MITQETLKTLDSALEDLNRLYFASFDLTQDELENFKHSIQSLEQVQQQIMLHLHKS